MQDLPAEIWALILSYIVDYRDICRLRLVSKDIKSLTESYVTEINEDIPISLALNFHHLRRLSVEISTADELKFLLGLPIEHGVIKLRNFIDTGEEMYEMLRNFFTRPKALDIEFSIGSQKCKISDSSKGRCLFCESYFLFDPRLLSLMGDLTSVQMVPMDMILPKTTTEIIVNPIIERIYIYGVLNYNSLPKLLEKNPQIRKVRCRRLQLVPRDYIIEGVNFEFHPGVDVLELPLPLNISLARRWVESFPNVKHFVFLRFNDDDAFDAGLSELLRLNDNIFITVYSFGHFACNSPRVNKICSV